MKISSRILILIIFFTGIKSYCQQELNRKDLISQLNADKESLFIINGTPFTSADSLKIDAELSKIEIDKITGITFLKNDGKISRERKETIIIQYVAEPPKNTIETK